jgi:hypothetical protein
LDRKIVSFAWIGVRLQDGSKDTTIFPFVVQRVG